VPRSPATPRRRRWQPQPHRRLLQVPDAAFPVFGSRGLRWTTLAEVAGRAGISKDTIHRYSPGKAALFTAMLTTRVNDFMPAVEAPRDPGPPPIRDRLAEVIHRAIVSGECRPVDPLGTARAFAGMFRVFAVAQELPGGKHIYPLAERTVVRILTDVFLHGLGVPAAGRPQTPRGAR